MCRYGRHASLVEALTEYGTVVATDARGYAKPLGYPVRMVESTSMRWLNIGGYRLYRLACLPVFSAMTFHLLPLSAFNPVR
jgi:hypothetical protein